jgi:anti-anti-sigma factor
MAGAGVPGTEQFSVTVDHRDGVTVVWMTGELDIFSVSALRECLDEVVVDAVGRTNLVVDLTGLTFMDSSGLGALVRTHKQVRVLRGSFGVVCCADPVLRLLKITGLTHVLRVADTLDAAIAGAEL